MLEVKVNKEIRDYTESMFFGLSLRQFVFSCLACGAAVGSYFLLRGFLGTEITSWVCILAALPFAVIGFAKYNGMPAEKFIAAYIKSELRTPSKLVVKNGCYFYPSEDQDKKQKKRRIPNDKFIYRKNKNKKKRKSRKDDMNNGN